MKNRFYRSSLALPLLAALGVGGVILATSVTGGQEETPDQRPATMTADERSAYSERNRAEAETRRHGWVDEFIAADRSTRDLPRVEMRAEPGPIMDIDAAMKRATAIVVGQVESQSMAWSDNPESRWTYLISVIRSPDGGTVQVAQLASLEFDADGSANLGVTPGDPLFEIGDELAIVVEPSPAISDALRPVRGHVYVLRAGLLYPLYESTSTEQMRGAPLARLLALFNVVEAAG